MDSFISLYQELSGQSINSEKEAVHALVKIKKQTSTFTCLKCLGVDFYQHKKHIEIFECKSCGHQLRIRKGSIFENSKISLVKWIKAIKLISQGKRGISALEIQRHLDLVSYNSAWSILQKIRFAMQERDAKYKLNGVVELDSSCIGSSLNDNQIEIILAVETKTWVDEKGKEKKNAGFAKVFFGEETKKNVQEFINKELGQVEKIRTDGAQSYLHLENKDQKKVEAKVMLGDKAKLKEWLPWVFAVTQNIKTWLNGTHHGVTKAYAKNYISEYIYRFNRRHDLKNLPSRLICHCLMAQYRKISEIKLSRFVA
jgi:transcription elongation factor Elf1